MHILDRLSKDLALLMERELTKPHADPQRLYIALLLLIGWKRGGSPSSNHQAGRSRLVSVDDSAAFEPEEPDSDDELDAASEEPLPAASDNVAFAEFVREAPFTHRNPYLSGLLFRDFYASHTPEECWLPGLGGVKIHAEASLYVEEVLWLKALGLAKSNGEKPTNLHLLLRRLCQLSRAAGAWADTDIVRRKNGKSIGLDVLWFRKNRLGLARTGQTLVCGRNRPQSPRGIRAVLAGDGWLRRNCR